MKDIRLSNLNKQEIDEIELALKACGRHVTTWFRAIQSVSMVSDYTIDEVQAVREVRNL